MSTWTVTTLLLIWIHVSVSAWWMLTSCPFSWLTLLFFHLHASMQRFYGSFVPAEDTAIHLFTAGDSAPDPGHLQTRLHHHTVSVGLCFTFKSLVVPVWCILWTIPNSFILCRQRFVWTRWWLCHQPKKTTKHRSRCARWILPRRSTRTHFRSMKWKSAEMDPEPDGSLSHFLRGCHMSLSTAPVPLRELRQVNFLHLGTLMWAQIMTDYESSLSGPRFKYWANFPTKKSGEMLLPSLMQHWQHPPQTLKGRRKQEADLVVGRLFSESILQNEGWMSALIFPHLFEAAKNPEVKNQSPYREKKRIISEKCIWTWSQQRDLTDPQLKDFLPLHRERAQTQPLSRVAVDKPKTY